MNAMPCSECSNNQTELEGKILCRHYDFCIACIQIGDGLKHFNKEEK